MFNNKITERIQVENGALTINCQGMVLQTSDGVILSVDSKEYRQYEPIWELIHLLPCNTAVSAGITEETQDVLRQALLGKHPQLSQPLRSSSEDSGRLSSILDALAPKTEADYVRIYSLICSGLGVEDANSPFICREDLWEYLCRFMSEDDAYKLSKAVRMGRLFGGIEYSLLTEQEYRKYKDILALLPEDTVNMFSKIKYLPEKGLMQRIIHYAVLAANSL